jgi:hypothetical protein
VVGDLLDRGAGDVGDLDPGPGRRLDVDVVEAGAEPGDDPQAVQRLDHAGAHRLGDDHQRLGGAAVLDQLLLGGAGALDEVHPVLGEEGALGLPEGDEGGVGLQDGRHPRHPRELFDNLSTHG